MNLSESLRTMRKRWVMTLSLLVLVGAAVVAAAVVLPKTYQSTAQVALIASKTDSKLYYDSNPYLAFDDSINVAADVLGRRMANPRVVSMLAAKGYTSSYKVEDAPNSPGPILLVTVTDKNPARAQSSLQGVTAALAQQLSSMQSDVSPPDRLTDSVLSSSLNASLSVSKFARPLAAVLVVGLVLVFSIPLIVEGISVKRRRKSKSPRTPEQDRWPGQGTRPAEGTGTSNAPEPSSPPEPSSVPSR
jgi:capsular polysaccharide biosynthesis protein